jgi:hypothetical protein
VYHEIGHNWDGFPANPVWYQFVSLSGWTNDLSTYLADPGAYVLSTDQSWWHSKSASFARDYAKTNPYEDYASSFQAYFLQFANESDVGANKIPQKIDNIDQLLDFLSS